MSPLITLLLPLASEEGGPGITPFLVGGTALLILLAMLFAVVAFGKGREHS
jgi:hypothetical protein